MVRLWLVVMSKMQLDSGKSSFNRRNFLEVAIALQNAFYEASTEFKINIKRITAVKFYFFSLISAVYRGCIRIGKS